MHQPGEHARAAVDALEGIDVAMQRVMTELVGDGEARTVATRERLVGERGAVCANLGRIEPRLAQLAIERCSRSP